MRDEDNLGGAAVAEIFESGKTGADAQIACNCAVLHGDVVVDADEDGFAFDIDISDSFHSSIIADF